VAGIEVLDTVIDEGHASVNGYPLDRYPLDPRLKMRIVFSRGDVNLRLVPQRLEVWKLAGHDELPHQRGREFVELGEDDVHFGIVHPSPARPPPRIDCPPNAMTFVSAEVGRAPRSQRHRARSRGSGGPAAEVQRLLRESFRGSLLMFCFALITWQQMGTR